jgi:hypothetical protein
VQGGSSRAACNSQFPGARAKRATPPRARRRSEEIGGATRPASISRDTRTASRVRAAPIGSSTENVSPDQLLLVRLPDPSKTTALRPDGTSARVSGWNGRASRRVMTWGTGYVLTMVYATAIAPRHVRAALERGRARSHPVTPRTETMIPLVEQTNQKKLATLNAACRRWARTRTRYEPPSPLAVDARASARRQLGASCRGLVGLDREDAQRVFCRGFKP